MIVKPGQEGVIDVCKPDDLDRLLEIRHKAAIPNPYDPSALAHSIDQGWVFGATDGTGNLFGYASATRITGPLSTFGPVCEYTGIDVTQMMLLSEVVVDDSLDGGFWDRQMVGDLAVHLRSEGADGMVTLGPCDDQPAQQATMCLGFEPFSRIRTGSGDRFIFYRVFQPEPYMWPDLSTTHDTVTGDPSEAVVAQVQTREVA